MEIKNYLKQLNINFKEYKHLPVFTVEEAYKYREKIRGIPSKTLFLKDRKSKRFYLIIIRANKKLDTEKYENLFNEKLKFANENDLKNVLEVRGGAVSPFGLINDKKSTVKAGINKEIWEPDYVIFHLNVNIETLELKKEDLHKHIESLKNEMIVT